MAFDLNQMVSDLKDVIAATWTDTAPGASGGGVWEMDQVEDTSFEFIAFPYGVIEFPQSEDAEWGIVNDAQEMSVSFHYVTERSFDTATLRTKLEALKSALFNATGFSGVNVLHREAIDWSGRHPANAIFMAKKAPYRAGSLVMRINFGESVF